jgi:SAM-dependent methyltransferase
VSQIKIARCVGAPMDYPCPMNDPQIRFDDGAAYEDFMGKWSQLAGDTFLQWLAPPPGRRWVDVGCGNGAFTEMLVERCAPIEVQGIDPSEEQVAFARTRLAGTAASLQVGDAMVLPFADAAFDAAVMALVIFFVPDPVKGVAEMARVVRPGGSVSAYAWDMLGGGFPFAAVSQEMATLGAPLLLPPSVEASRIETMRSLWHDAGLVDVETRRIEVERSFADFAEFWRIAQTGPRVAPRLAAMAPGDVVLLQERLRARLAPDAGGRIAYGASANAIKGRVAG